MNKRIRELADQIWAEEYWDNPNTDKLLPAQLAKFVDMIVQDTLRLLRQQWYDINNAVVQDETSRDIAIRVGRKTEILNLMHMIKQHYGIETGIDAMAGDGGYTLGTAEKQAEFAAKRNYEYREL
jgi:hypothetical protein